MIPSLTFIFLKALLTHRQEFFEDTGENSINYASFGNQKILHDMRKLFEGANTSV